LYRQDTANVISRSLNFSAISPVALASGQRDTSIVSAHSAPEDARERACGTRPEPGSSARGRLWQRPNWRPGHAVAACPARARPCHKPPTSRRANNSAARAGARVTEATGEDWPIGSGAGRREHVPLAILLMVAATVVFTVSSALSKWLVARYPIGEVLFTRTAVALATCALFILPQTGLAVFR